MRIMLKKMFLSITNLEKEVKSEEELFHPKREKWNGLLKMVGNSLF